MTNREFDEKVARMMGWERNGPLHHPWTRPDGWGFSDVPHFGTDPSADYEVLKHVRETWSTEKFTLFIKAFESRVSTHAAVPREVNSWAMYIPGDYSRAALSALEAPIDD